MKRINTTKLMALLASLCLITSSFVGSTLAKYTTSDEGKDTARVAKFGVAVTATSDTMFATQYNDEDADYAGLSVKSDTTDMLVAPGTNGTLTKLTITGTPEVAVRVTNDAELTLTNWEIAGTEYCPIVITVGGTEYKIDSTITTVAALETAVEEAIEAYTKDYEPGVDLSVKTDALPVVSWAWAFEGDDVKDTALGDQAAEGNAATITLDLTTTVTQIN